MVDELMGILDKLKKKMQEVSQEGAALEEKAFPTTEELQASKKNRKETAGKVTDWMAEKGYPRAGAVAGTAIDMTADAIPESQKDYAESMYSSGNVGSVGKIGKLKGAMPSMEIKAMKPGAEELGKRWAGLSGAERALFNNDRAKYISDQLAEEARVAAQADNARKALREEVRSNPKGDSDLSSSYKQVDQSKRRMMDPSKKIEAMSVRADAEAGKVAPKAAPEEMKQKIEEAVFPKHEGPSFQQQIASKRKDAEMAEEIRKRLGRK